MQLRTYLLGAAMALASTTAFAAVPATTPIPGVKNVIIIVNDGGGPTVYDAARLYLGHPLVTDGPGFKQTFVSTYPLRQDSSANNKPGVLTQQASTVYSSAKFWNTKSVAGLSKADGYNSPGFNQAGFAPIPGPLYPAAFQGYEFSRIAHPDSGNTATSLASGIKTYNNAINVDGAGTPSITITDLIGAANSAGKATGVVSTVQFSDATPAALGGAHNIARSNRTAIAAEMFSTGKLDVIGGTGNPDFDDDGNARTPQYTWIGQSHWTDLKAGTNASGLNGPTPWTLVQEKADIDALAAGTVTPPRKLAMIMKGDLSHQFNRTNTVLINGAPINATQDTVYGTPLKTNVPTQASLTIAALNTLAANPKAGNGIYLMSEAGAVDRAEHANDTARMIEEQIASDETVQAVIDWVDRDDTVQNWDNTVLIVTADHDHLLYGPQADNIPFQPLVDNGPGVVPGNKWFGPNHGTGLVPLFVYGNAATQAQIVNLARKSDTYKDKDGRVFGHGAYADQTDIGKKLKATVSQ